MGSKKSDFGDGASPGKIFIGGLAKDATLDQFTKGFGFITYADPSVVDTVIAETHVINGKQPELCPQVATCEGGFSTCRLGHVLRNQKELFQKVLLNPRISKTKKIFVGGIPTSVTEDEFKSFFSKYGKVVEHEIIRDHVTKRSRGGFGFIIFDNEQVVDTILTNGNMIDMEGTQVEIKKAEPKKSSNPAPASAYGSDSRGRGYGEGFGGFGNSYSGFGPPPYRTFGGLGSRFGDYGGYGGGGGSEFGGRYGDFGGSDYMDYRGEPSLGSYSSSRYGSYGGGFNSGYGGSGLGAYGRGGGGYGSYGGSGSGASYDSGPGAGYGGAGGIYGGRAGYSGGSRYHPYGR
ncbi:RNA-binding (RRM/RBD/RNP motifs) family protein [Actinidia rufa]|uniref:RNA-binding (RRM/RBD/RNP motifs) family protein n=1 Tax=Actinidia rufa TaxID=165716 RepID=A0A7J0G3L4_9ERIC|nr:RNA-binding (RRM/RBD/RNP motifs) family protein [Actinidia rufa]